MCNKDLFDINGSEKLTDKMVAEREAIIMHHAKNPKSVFFCSHSAGKDSAAMYEYLLRLVPKERIVVVHATLGSVEHDGVVEHIKENIEHPLHIVLNERKDFVDMVLLRGMFPSPKFRQCTSDLKTSPIYSFIKRYMNEHGYTHGFNVSGLRAEESAKRAMKNPLWINKQLTLNSGKRVVFDWMPCFHLEESEVYQTILEAGKQPHPAYGDRACGGNTGNQRLSCKFCIMGSTNDLMRAAMNYPDHYAEMIALELVVNHTMFGRSRTIHTDLQLTKGVELAGGKVLESIKNTSKRAVMPYKNKVFIPVPLDEKVGAPVDEVAVQRHVVRLTERLVMLKERVNSEKELKALKKKEAANKIGSKNIKRDDSTIDFLDMLSI
ncbi:MULTISPECIES: phosphoadenosine phosphosulfate reductase family protein [Pseudoalteromonas]|uniref:phosphoadenosine phosphosulfate reductase domain-containing protein n=1 Tax=Pseudoalteromonas TaxID=53246 RepID=UPI00158289DE|nr:MULTISPECIES: phosphoadenosine phosphosulfate reductase family protein [Pseudoalteromonas]MDI4654231.1 phosphoadenosine phosphosulfate reductase family protein [Pseudoalteromonas shioyasakiensis]NUJ40185.1 phosphoadenosine phosphosulfate reductase family protein [Pseudoalteromonas sp. 0303]